MTTQLLANELANLVQESKRKHNDLRQAAERSLEELKGLKGMSEAQACAAFVNPLIIACSTKSPKFTSPAIVCLQRLIAARALPPAKLDQVLEAMRYAAESGSQSGGGAGGGGGGSMSGVVGGAPVVDAQLKILQALPALLANYADEIGGRLLMAALDVCFVLQACRNGIVNNTAAATLQQLVVAVFDKVDVEDKQGNVPVAGDVDTKDGSVKLGPAALDAYRVLDDICLLTEGLRPNHLGASQLLQTFGLELIESVLTQHAALFSTHPEQVSILRDRVLPLIVSTLGRGPNFATTVRLARILYTLLRRHLDLLPRENGDALEMLTQLLDGDAPLWRRAVCMEVFRGVFAEAALLRRIFALYDGVDGDKRAILKTLTATLVRVSTERPAVIGLGHQSTIPVSTGNGSSNGGGGGGGDGGGGGGGIGGIGADQALLETGVIGGTIGADDYGPPVSTGVGAQWSSVRVPCIDQLDKTEPPPIPDSYIYSLTLTCISSLSEGLAKFILPLTVPGEGRARRRAANNKNNDNGRDSPVPGEGQDRPVPTRKKTAPLNPLSNAEHPLHKDVRTCAAMVDECWPAVLATCSTFLYAALDSEYYHALVRAFQKFAHVAGLLQLPTPRDAFLTTLGKAAVPPNVFTAALVSGSTRRGGGGGGGGGGAPSSAASTHGSSAGHSNGGGGVDGQGAGLPAATTASGILSNARGLLGVDSVSSSASNGLTDRTRPGSADASVPGTSSSSTTPATLNTRNLLCLRALLNLGIALGPTLGSSWTIIIETLQQADLVLFVSGKAAGRTMLAARGHDVAAEAESNALLASFAGEVRAVETAASRLMESTADFPNDAFVHVVDAICGLLHSQKRVPTWQIQPGQAFAQPDDTRPPETHATESRPETPMSAGMRTPTSHGQHRRINSLGGSTPSPGNQEDLFALAKLGDVAHINMDRLLAGRPGESGWTRLVDELVAALSAGTLGSAVRARAADALVRLVLEAAALAAAMSPQSRGTIQLRLLEALRNALAPLRASDRPNSVAHHAVDVDIYRIVIEGLRSLLDNCGEGIVAGWDVAFDVIGSIFVLVEEDGGRDDDDGDGDGDSGAKHQQQQRLSLATRSPRLIRSAFGSLQLICSDFLAALPNSCFLILVDTLYRFCSQRDDLNIALTTVTFFWVLSDHLSARQQSFAITATLVSPQPGHDDDDGGNDERRMRPSSATPTPSLLATAADDADESADAALWMVLLLRLTTVTSDSRVELRNSAIQTLLRIFDAYGERLSPEAWTVCVETVIFRLLVSVQEELAADGAAADGDRARHDEDRRRKSRDDWHDTAVVVLAGVADLLASYLDVLAAHPAFDRLWAELLGHLADLVSLGVLVINTAAFKALGQILSHATSSTATSSPSLPSSSSSSSSTSTSRFPVLSPAAVDAVWDLWSHGVPVAAPQSAPPASSSSTVPSADNQDCLLAYVSALGDVYRLVQPDLAVSRVGRILVLLREVVRSATPPGYTADIEYVTPLQGCVVDAIRSIRTDVAGVPAVVVSEVAQLARLAFDGDEDRWRTAAASSGKSPKRTFVALSKAAMALLEGLVLGHASDPDLYTSGALAAALSALARPISLKYAFPLRTTKSASPWRAATSAALAILDVTLPQFLSLTSDSPWTIKPATTEKLWTVITTIAAAIVAADCTFAKEPVDDVARDEEFDIASYMRLRAIIVPALGAHYVPNGTRSRFARSLYSTSIIHQDDEDEHKDEDDDEDGNEDHDRDEDGDGTRQGQASSIDYIRMPRRGRTSDPTPTRRAAMAYVCLDELFSLVSAPESTTTTSPPSLTMPGTSSRQAHPSIMIHPPTPIHPTAGPLTEPLTTLHARISTAVAPLLVGRVAAVLRAYAADQPLRGMMPQPASRRREMRHVLQRLVALRCLVPSGAGDELDQSACARSLACLTTLYPLVVRAGSVVGWRGRGGDAEIAGLITDALDVAGGVFAQGKDGW